jgi:hypothetical protein
MPAALANMSDSEVFESVTVTSEGVTVTKRYEEDEFPVPAIAFEFASDRDEAVTVRFTDRVPEGVAVEDLGFHPEYGSEHWTVEEETIVFERELDANSEYTTVYGIRATGTDDIQKFLTEPTIEEVDPPLDEDTDELDKSIPDVGEAEETSTDDDEDEDEEEQEPEEDVGTLELNDPNESQQVREDDEADDAESETGDEDEDEGEDEGEGEDEDEDEDEDEADDAESEAGDEDVAEDDEAEDELSEAIEKHKGGESESEGVGEDEGVEDEDSESDQDRTDGETDDGSVRLEGSLVSALAEEIRENDVPEEDLEPLREALAQEDEDESAGPTEARIEKLQSDIADLRAYTDALEEFLDENGTAEQLIGEFEQQLEEFSSDVDAFQSDVDSNSTAIDEMDGTLDAISKEVDDMGEQLTDTSTDVEDLQTSVEELESMIGDEEVLDRIEDVEAQISDLESWQEQIKQTFGG